MVNQKKARELGKEVIRCEQIIENAENYTELEVKQAMSKINLITQAYSKNPDMLFAIVLEADKIYSNKS